MAEQFARTDGEFESHRHDSGRTVIVTGASGVVGRALMSRLRHSHVICLAHRQPVQGHGVTTVFGDIAAPELGLPQREYRNLVARADAVIHCAAVTDFHRSDGSLEATNINGTANVVALAEAAEATLYHVSTAFVHTETTGARGSKAVNYAASKRSGEAIVKAAQTPHVILRPSIVIGDSRSGYIETFQGLHQVAAAISAGSVPMIPFDPTWPIDFVPSDFVADAIASVYENQVAEGEFWITAGDRALRLAEAVALCVAHARDVGAALDAPRFVPPDLFDRLIGPVFLDALPIRVKMTVLKLLEFFSTYLAAGTALPSSHPALQALGVAALPNQAASLQRSLDYWSTQSGFAAKYATAKVA